MTAVGVAEPPAPALGATVTLVSTQGTRSISVNDFYANDGMHYLTKRADELVTAIVLPDPAGWRKNMMTRPFGAQVGPSLWKPEVRMRSPEPSGRITPIENRPPDCLVKAIRSPRGDQTGVE